MDLSASPRQVELAATLRSLIADRFDPSQWESLVATDPGYDRALWAALVAGGWVTVGFPETVGGSGGGVTDLVAVIEELGRGPVPTPVQNGVVQSAGALMAACPDETHLRSLLTGQRRYALCMPDLTDDSVPTDDTALRATPSTRGWMLDGVTSFVPYAYDADELLVVAATPSGDRGDGLTLFTVSPTAPGLSATAVPTLGGDHQHRLAFTSVAVGTDRVLGRLGAARQWLPGVLDVARVALAAEMVGSASAALDHASRWVRERHQFGVPVGSMQAVQHRLADALIDVLTARDAVYDAAGIIDRGDDATAAVAAAKAYCGEACRRVTAAAHQVCGGNGIFADQPLHLWHRRVESLVPMLGTNRWCRRTVASALFDR